MAVLISVFSISIVITSFSRLFYNRMAFYETTLTVFVFLIAGFWLLQPDYDFWTELNCALSGYTFCPGTSMKNASALQLQN